MCIVKHYLSIFSTYFIFLNYYIKIMILSINIAQFINIIETKIGLIEKSLSFQFIKLVILECVSQQNRV